MAELHPCPECNRHIRATETACPFCAAAITHAPIARRLPIGRLTRAAVFASALAGTAAACGPSKPKTDTPQDKQQQMTPDAQAAAPTPGPADAGAAEPPPPATADAATPPPPPPPPDHPIPKPYGAPPVRNRIV